MNSRGLLAGEVFLTAGRTQVEAYLFPPNATCPSIFIQAILRIGTPIASGWADTGTASSLHNSLNFFINYFAQISNATMLP
jgi:hypothetical protein